MKKFIHEFKEFALKGNVMNLAVGVIIGAALKINNNAISVIGGVDGPTSVFVATKLNSS